MREMKNDRAKNQSIIEVERGRVLTAIEELEHAIREDRDQNTADGLQLILRGRLRTLYATKAAEKILDFHADGSREIRKIMEQVPVFDQTKYQRAINRTFGLIFSILLCLFVGFGGGNFHYWSWLSVGGMILGGVMGIGILVVGFIVDQVIRKRFLPWITGE